MLNIDLPYELNLVMFQVQERLFISEKAIRQLLKVSFLRHLFFSFFAEFFFVRLKKVPFFAKRLGKLSEINVLSIGNDTFSTKYLSKLVSQRFYFKLQLIVFRHISR